MFKKIHFNINLCTMQAFAYRAAACLVFLLVVVLISPRTVSTQTDDLGKLLQKVDAYRVSGKDDSLLSVEISAIDEPERLLEVYTDGTRTLVKFLKPAKEEGRLMLKEDVKSLWLLIPGNKRLVRISQTQRLIGQVSIGDVLSVNFSKDYKAISLEDSAEDDRSYVLELERLTKYAQYARIKLWVDKETDQALKSEHFANSGKLLKTARYTKYGDVRGAVKLLQAVVSDDIKNGEETIINYLDYQPVELPEGFLSKDNLGSL